MTRGLVVSAAWMTLAGCPPTQPPAGSFNNTTDPTNGGASYVGSAACSACHPDIASLNRLHGHNQALKAAQGAPPQYPDSNTRAGVPNPPPGFAWTDISYVIGGYTHGAQFVNQMGDFIAAQWRLSFPANGTQPNFFVPDATIAALQPFTYDCFRCHTTGPVAQSASNPDSQGGRPGIGGTWAEDGVHCEACHGPGSRHIPNPAARNNFVDFTTRTCGRCHAAPDTPDNVIVGNSATSGTAGAPGPAGNFIPAAGGYVSMFTQVNELRASGGHSSFTCEFCHDPHASTVYDAAHGIRNQCADCHTDAVHSTLPLHDGLVFRRGDYVEPLTCQSCHMGFTGLSASTATAAVAGPFGRMGDVRGHIFRINPNSTSFADMFTADGTAVALDAQGHAAVTLDFICLRCHTGIGNAIPLTPAFVLDVAPGLHTRVAATTASVRRVRD